MTETCLGEGGWCGSCDVPLQETKCSTIEARDRWGRRLIAVSWHGREPEDGYEQRGDEAAAAAGSRKRKASKMGGKPGQRQQRAADILGAGSHALHMATADMDSLPP